MVEVIGTCAALLSGRLAISLINRLRRQNKINFNLTHNCLVTQGPIVFLHGPESLLYKGHSWNQIPEFLFEHGYDTLMVPKKQKTLCQFKSWILTLPSHKKHIIGTWADIKLLSQIVSDPLINNSVWLVHDGSQTPETQIPNGIQILNIERDLHISRIKSMFLAVYTHLACQKVCSRNLADPTWGHPLPILNQYLFWAKTLAEKDYSLNPRYKTPILFEPDKLPT